MLTVKRLGVVAWLSCVTRNHVGSALAGSNPVTCVFWGPNGSNPLSSPPPQHFGFNFDRLPRTSSTKDHVLELDRPPEMFFQCLDTCL